MLLHCAPSYLGVACGIVGFSGARASSETYFLLLLLGSVLCMGTRYRAVYVWYNMVQQESAAL